MVTRFAFAVAFIVALAAVVTGIGGDAFSGLLALIGLGGVWVLRHRADQARVQSTEQKV